MGREPIWLQKGRAMETEVFEPYVAPPSDRLAKDKAAALGSNEDLDSDGKKKEHGRHQWFQEHANLVVVGLLWTVAVFILIKMSVYFLHLIMPEPARGLLDNSLDSYVPYLLVFSSSV